MKQRIVTLFGEEVIPEQAKPVKPKREKEPELPKEPSFEDAPNTNILNNWEAQKGYYSIGEVAELFKVNTSHIRFWSNEFKLKLRTNRKGDRLYTPENIQKLGTIYHLVKEKGFTLAGAKSKLKESKKIKDPQADRKKSLLAFKKQLLAIRKSLLA